jgi:hypothetical protein
VIAAAAIAPATARAEPPEWGMPAVLGLDARATRPLSGGPTAYGAGITMSVVPNRIPGYLALDGGFAITPRSSNSTGTTRTDTFTFGGDFGWKAEHEHGDLLIPYAGVSLRLLSIAHHRGAETRRLTTAGIGASAGIMGDLPGAGVFYRLAATALAAHTPDGVPGTSVVVSVGVGTRFGF